MMDDGRWMVDGGWELNPSEEVLRLYFRNFTDLQPSNASFPISTFSFELSICTLSFYSHGMLLI